jgi:cystathionine beta-lyase
MRLSKTEDKNYGKNTNIMHSGRAPDEYFGIVNAPVSRSSTILYPSLDAFEDPNHLYKYGRYGTPTTKHFEAAMAELEGGFGACVAPAGSCAISTAIWAFLKAGDHFLMVDSAYSPTRDFCDNILARYGVEVEYYDPFIGADIKDLIRDNTTAIFMESPGSATFDVQDVPAIVAAAKAKGVLTILDGSWSSGILFKPFDHGVDISIHSASKYICGHSDIMLGVAIARTEELYKTLRKAVIDLGVCAGPDDMFLALRGLRTLPIRIKEAGQRAASVIDGIKNHSAVQKIYYPALTDHPNHDIWKRDFSGANGIFSVLLKPKTKAATRRCIDALDLFPIGSSWGGYESLLQPQRLTARSASPWTQEGALLRFQVGLEDTDDLIKDLNQAFDAFEAA